MDSTMELPYDLLWPGKMEPKSPGGKCSPFTTSGAAHHADDELWPMVEGDTFLSYFHDLEDNDFAIATTIEEQLKKEIERETKTKTADELLLDLVELREQGQWINQENVDLSSLTGAMAPLSPAMMGAQPLAGFGSPSATSSLYSSLASTPSMSPLGAGTGLMAPGCKTEDAAEFLFNEIKSFCSDYEAGAYQQLTPPQSPPQKQQQQSPLSQSTGFNAASSFLQVEARSFVDLQLQSNDSLEKTFVFPNHQHHNDKGETLRPASAVTGPMPVPALDADQFMLDTIDELIRGSTKEVLENYVLLGDPLEASNDAAVKALTAMKMDAVEMEGEDSEDTQFSSPSFASGRSTPSRCSGSLSMDDEEWAPAAEAKKRKGTASSSGGSGSRATKRRPYERGGGEVEKKSRKKEQNKNAATRYRMKKKQEVEVILGEESKLIKLNKKLQTQYSDARRELKYLKNLLRDMYKQNNIIV